MDSVLDDGSLSYHTDSSTASNRVFTGNSALNGSFDSDGTPIIASLDVSSKLTGTTTAISINEKGTSNLIENNGASSTTKVYSIALVNTSPMVAKVSTTYHFEFDGSASHSGSGSSGSGGGGYQPGNSGGNNSPGQAPDTAGFQPTVATLTFQIDSSGSSRLTQLASGSTAMNLYNGSQTKIGQSSGTYSQNDKLDSKTATSQSGTWNLLANSGTIHKTSTLDTENSSISAASYHYELTQEGVLYDAGSSTNSQGSFHEDTKIDGLFDSIGKQVGGTSHTYQSGTTNTPQLNSWERYQSKDQPTWTKNTTGDAAENRSSTLDLVFASDGKASGTSTGNFRSILNFHDLSSWVGTQRIMDPSYSASGSSSSTGGGTNEYLPGQIGTLAVNDHGEDALTTVGDSAWNLTYAADQPQGDSSSTVMVSGTTSWNTDHIQVLNQNGHTEYKTIGQDKMALTGSDAIHFDYNADKISGGRTTMVANHESHNLAIDGIGSGIGNEGWSGDWKYHYQSQDLVDDTDTKGYSWTNSTWAESSHVFRTDHQGSSSWTFTQGQSYNSVLNPLTGYWQTQISTLSMGGSSSYHDVSWGGTNSLQFTKDRNSSYNKTSSGSGNYGFGLSGANGNSAYNSVETSSFHDNRSGSTVNGTTIYNSIDIYSLGEKTSWTDSHDYTNQTNQSIRNDDWNRSELIITGNSNTLTTTKNNAFNKVQTYSYSAAGTPPPSGSFTQSGNITSTTTANGSGTGAALGGGGDSNPSGQPSTVPQTNGYVPVTIIVNGQPTPGGLQGSKSGTPQGILQLRLTTICSVQSVTTCVLNQAVRSRKLISPIL